MRQKPATLIVVPFLIFFVVLLLVIFHIPILSAIGDFLVIQDDLHPADIIHVISGPDYRTDYGIKLMKEGFARNIFFTGPWCAEVQDVHADRGRQRALDQGIPAESILTDNTEIISTYEEAQRLKILIDQGTTPVKSVIIVSDPFHMRRAKWTYRKVLGSDVEIQMAPVPFEMTSFSQRWWEDRASRRNVREEYVKSAYYLLRYGLAWSPLSNWLANFDRE